MRTFRETMGMVSARCAFADQAIGDMLLAGSITPQRAEHLAKENFAIERRWRAVRDLYETHRASSP